MEESSGEPQVLRHLEPQQVLKHINLAREYPKYYLALVDEQLSSFLDHSNMQIQQDVIYETIEGQPAWQQAREFLINQEPLRPLEYHPGLFQASLSHAKDIASTQSTGHQGSDGSTFVDRVQRYCRKGKGSMIQLLGTTYLMPQKNSIELALLNLIIDDGVSNRGHRKALFSKGYKYIGASFVEGDEKVCSVIAMAQSNLEVIREEPQNIATSTSQLRSMKNTEPKIPSVSVINQPKENCIEDYSSVIEKPTRNKSLLQPSNDPVWTLKNVTNIATDKQDSKSSLTSKKSTPDNISAEPSIFKGMEPSRQSKSSINSSRSEKPVSDKPEQRSSKRMQSSHSHLKENTLKASQNSIKSQAKEKESKGKTFGLSSNVQEFQLKSTFNSPFLKTSTSGFGTVGSKRVVEKKETMRTYNQDQFLIKEVTTVVKYEDGMTEDWVQKHSLLKSSSILKEGSL